MASLKRHLLQCAGLGDREAERLAANMASLHLDKGGILLAPGVQWSSHAFVAAGCLRVFFTDEDGTQRILYFAPEGWWATDIDSFLTGAPSVLSIDALEASDVLLIDKVRLEGLRREVPWVDRLIRTLQERALVTLHRRIVGSLHKTAAERYAEFVQQYPGLAGRIPQYQIAAYVGVTAEFLSILRRRGVAKDLSSS